MSESQAPQQAPSLGVQHWEDEPLEHLALKMGSNWPVRSNCRGPIGLREMGISLLKGLHEPEGPLKHWPQPIKRLDPHYHRCPRTLKAESRGTVRTWSVSSQETGLHYKKFLAYPWILTIKCIGISRTDLKLPAINTTSMPSIPPSFLYQQRKMKLIDIPS